MLRNTRKRQTGFFVEFRLHGFAKGYAKWVKKQLHDDNVTHITLFGPAYTDNIKNVISEVVKIGQNYKYTLVPFSIDGFGCFDDTNVIYLDIDPSPLLKELRLELAQRLLNVSSTKSKYDYQRQFKFHSTARKFKKISKDGLNKYLEHVNTNCRVQDYERYKKWHKITIIETIVRFFNNHFGMPEDDKRISQYLLRITILGKRSRIMYEYDLVLKRLLDRRESLSRHIWQRTIRKLRELQG